MTVRPGGSWPDPMRMRGRSAPIVCTAVTARCPAPLPPSLPAADIPLPANAQLLADVEEESKAKEPEKWLELGLQSLG